MWANESIHWAAVSSLVALSYLGYNKLTLLPFCLLYNHKYNRTLSLHDRISITSLPFRNRTTKAATSLTFTNRTTQAATSLTFTKRATQAATSLPFTNRETPAATSLTFTNRATQAATSLPFTNRTTQAATSSILKIYVQ